MVRAADSPNCGLAERYVVKNHPDKEALRGAGMAAETVALRAGWNLTAGRIARSPDGLDNLPS